MKELRIEEESKLADIINSIKDTPEAEIEIITTGTDIFDVGVNKEIVKLASESFGKKVTFKGKQLPSGKAGEEVGKRENLGFVEGKDIAEEKEQKEEAAPRPFKKRRFPKLPFPKWPKWVYALIGSAGLIFITGILTFWFVPSATITLFTEQQFKESEISLVASDVIEKADKENGIIPLQTIETDEEDSIESKATGSKTIGSKAKGRVKIVNRDSNNNKTFFKGTVVSPISGSSIKFSLDKTATISAAPVGCEADCPAVGVDVTAKVIGSEGNLKSGTVFKVGSADVNLVFAKNETNFSGGSSKKVTVISASDHKKAKEDLIKKMEEKAKSDLEEENQGIIIPDGGFENEILEEVYSKNVGEEADNFRLSIKVRFIAIYFSEDDLKVILVEAVSEELPNDLKLDEENIFISSEILGKNDGELNIIGKIKAPLIPIIDEDEVRRNVAGKGFGQVDGYLKSLNSILGFEIKVNPALFRFFGRLPFSRNSISIEVIQEE